GRPVVAGQKTIQGIGQCQLCSAWLAACHVQIKAAGLKVTIGLGQLLFTSDEGVAGRARGGQDAVSCTWVTVRRGGDYSRSRSALAGLFTSASATVSGCPTGR